MGRLGELSVADYRRRIAREGLVVRIGPFHVRLRVRLAQHHDQLRLLYADYPLVEGEAILDFDVMLARERAWWGRLTPGARPGAALAALWVDGARQFEPFDPSIAVPMLEWCLNWCTFRLPNQYLILHSAVVAKDDRAAILPGIPGAGKSTLCAALVHHGWRLLSDEVALISPQTGMITAAPLPISLKEGSIQVIRRYCPAAVIGQASPGTRKGTVAHVAPPRDSLDQVHQPAAPAWIICPRYQAGSAVTLRPLSRAQMLLTIAHDAFNYSLLGEAGFATLTRTVEACDCQALVYSDLDEALATFDALAHVASHAPAAAFLDCVGNDTALACGGAAFARRKAKAVSQPPQSKEVLLPRVLAEPARMAELSPSQWIALLRHARLGRLVARLGWLARQQGLWDRLPAKVRDWFTAEQAVAAQHERIVRWEVNRVARALRDVDSPVVLLKGAAYVMGDLATARGRLVSDVDIMVPRDRLETVEAALQHAGWEPMKLDPYDQRYYRAWMHELPPMLHRQRQSVIDVHHTILPVTGRLRPDPAKLFADATPIAGHDGRFAILSPPDMVLHAAAHMFQDGELDGSIRDLADIHSLLTEFGVEAGFWERLVARARELTLERPLYYALRNARGVLGTAVPPGATQASKSFAPLAPVPRMMDALIARAILPPLPGRHDALGRAARMALYIRSHWLKMPPKLLAQHLYHKAARRFKREEEKPALASPHPR
ncbi:MAG: HprK-related kinase A [Phycisphaeraceae bacterium]